MPIAHCPGFGDHPSISGERENSGAQCGDITWQVAYFLITTPIVDLIFGRWFVYILQHQVEDPVWQGGQTEIEADDKDGHSRHSRPRSDSFPKQDRQHFSGTLPFHTFVLHASLRFQSWWRQSHQHQTEKIGVQGIDSNFASTKLTDNFLTFSTSPKHSKPSKITERFITDPSRRADDRKRSSEVPHFAMLCSLIFDLPKYAVWLITQTYKVEVN